MSKQVTHNKKSGWRIGIALLLLLSASCVLCQASYKKYTQSFTTEIFKKVPSAQVFHDAGARLSGRMACGDEADVSMIDESDTEDESESSGVERWSRFPFLLYQDFSFVVKPATIVFAPFRQTVFHYIEISRVVMYHSWKIFLS